MNKKRLSRFDGKEIDIQISPEVEKELEDLKKELGITKEIEDMNIKC